MKDHKLIKHGTGPGVWGECSCGVWCWLGTNFGEKRRYSELRAQFADHVQRSSVSACIPDLPCDYPHDCAGKIA